jgi:hypothetical protein
MRADWIHQAQNTVYCEHSNGPFGPIKGGEFLDQLNDYCLLKKNSVHGVRSVPKYRC